MAARSRHRSWTFGALVAAALLTVGCDTGGLLVIEGSSSTGGEELPPVSAASELVSGGNFARNGQYKLFYTVGQPTPNQNVATAPGQRLHGGIVGAVH